MSLPAGAAPEISVVLPVYNEAENLPVLVGELREALEPTGRSYEILIVDDASTDDGVAVARGLAERFAEVRIARHRFNCGQSAAVASGFRRARGRVIITMDSDLQNVPADIPRYLDALTEGVDCVCGIRAKRNDSASRRLSSKIANGFRNWITRETIRDAGCGFRAIRRDALAEVPVFNGMHRFLPTLLRAQGLKVVEIEISHRPRTRGVSKYGVGNRLWRGIRDCFAIRWYGARAVKLRRLVDEEKTETNN